MCYPRHGLFLEICGVPKWFQNNGKSQGTKMVHMENHPVIFHYFGTILELLEPFWFQNSGTARRLIAERAEERISPKNPEKAAKYAAARAAEATQAAPAACTPAVPAERVTNAEKAAAERVATAEKVAAMAFAAAEKAAAERIAAAEKAAAEQKAQFMTFQVRILDENLKLEQEKSEYKSTIHDKNKKAGHRETI